MSFEQVQQSPGSSMVICQSCEAEVPSDASHCPSCCGEDGQLGATKRRGFIGALVGLMGGGVSAALISSIIGPERSSSGLVFGITFVGVALGLAVAFFGKRHD